MTLRSPVDGRASEPSAVATDPTTGPAGTDGDAGPEVVDQADGVQAASAGRRLAAMARRPAAAMTATVAAWCVAVYTWGHLWRETRPGGGLGWDLLITWRAEKVFALGGAPYAVKAFVYPPSCLLVLRPLAALSHDQLTVGGLAVTFALVWAAVMLTANALGLRWWGLTAAVTLALLPFTVAMRGEASLENVTVLGFVALAGFLAFALRDHWIAAGAVIGLSLSVKPLLLAVLVVFLLARQWRGLAVAVAVPVVLNVAAVLLVPHPGQVFNKLPSLLNRSGVGVNFNSAWVDVTRTLGLPVGASMALRAATVVLAIVTLWLAWSRLADPRLRIVVAASVALIASFLSGTLSENHFMLAFIPLAMTIVLAGSPMRQVTAVIATVWLMGELVLPRSVVGFDNTTANLSFFRAVGMSIVLITLAVVLARRPVVAGATWRDPATWARGAEAPAEGPADEPLAASVVSATGAAS